MKTMNTVITMAILCMGLSCSKESPMDEAMVSKVDYRSRLEASQTEAEDQEIFELDLHQYAVMGELASLFEAQRRLDLAIEAGDTRLIPDLEVVLEKQALLHRTLEDILNETCFYLRLRLAYLENQASQGQRSAEEEIDEIEERLRECEKSAEEQAVRAMETQTLYLYIKAPGKGGIGGRCNPDEEWTCFDDFMSDVLLLNITESQSQPSEVILKDSRGRIVSTGSFRGAHPTMEGVTQMAIELRPVEHGTLEIRDVNGSYGQPITVR